MKSLEARPETRTVAGLKHDLMRKLLFINGGKPRACTKFAFEAVLLCCALAVAGCQSYGGAGLAGAALGAGAGAIIGHQSGHAGQGALIGAAVGGLTGLAVHDVVAKKKKDGTTTSEEYRYEPAQGEMLTFEEASVLPSSVQRGTMAEATIQYALLGTGSGIAVTETRVLKRGTEVLAQLSSKTYTRNDGTWVSSQQFRVSERLQPGEYVVEQTVRTAQSVISGTAKFTVH